jgi:hypothetical protein
MDMSVNPTKAKRMQSGLQIQKTGDKAKIKPERRELKQSK